MIGILMFTRIGKSTRGIVQRADKDLDDQVETGNLSPADPGRPGDTIIDTSTNKKFETLTTTCVIKIRLDFTRQDFTISISSHTRNAEVASERLRPKK